MEQQIRRPSYAYLEDIIDEMKGRGYYVKQISGTGDANYVWVLFEKITTNIETI